MLVEKRKSKKVIFVCCTMIARRHSGKATSKWVQVDYFIIRSNSEASLHMTEISNMHRYNKTICESTACKS